MKYKKDITKHKKSETCKKIQYLLSKNIDNYKNTIDNQRIQIELLQKQNEDKDKQIKLLEDKAEEYRKIVEKAAIKSTSKTTVKNNYTHNNNYLNYISSDPLKLSEIQDKMKNVVTAKTIMWNDNDFHNHIVDKILKDDYGKDKVLCTDINRKNFSYKDETSGELISDPELERLREQLKIGADDTTAKRDLLDKLIKKYEGTGIDPYNKFYDMLQKLNFGLPFVDHIAKKTYIKTKCTNFNNNDNTIDNNDDIN
jgi:hypothetical protein